MDWRITGAIGKVLGFVPGGARMHDLLQKRSGGQTDFARECEVEVEAWRLMMGHLRASNIKLKDATFLEMGTGRCPTFAFCLYLAGAKRIHTLDLHPHLEPDRTLAIAARLEAHAPLIAKESGRPVGEVDLAQLALATALRDGADLEKATKGVVSYKAPGDAAHTGLPAASVDVVFSNHVLEHVPARVIDDCFTEAVRILKPGGVVFHSVNCGDRYADVDASIDPLHYLQFSDAQWKKWNNDFLYQNRLRAVDFTDMAKRAGFAIEIDTARAKPERLAVLDRMTIDAKFGGYTREQLAVTSIDFVGRKR